MTRTTHRLCPACHRLVRASDFGPTMKGPPSVVAVDGVEAFLLGTCPVVLASGEVCGNSLTVPLRMLDLAEAAACGLDVTADGRCAAA